MRIAILGAGRVGATLGKRWRDAGYDVVYGVRDPGEARYAELGDVREAAAAVAGSGVVLIAVPWPAVASVLAGLGVGSAVVIDATNRGAALDDGPSGAEQVAALTGSSRVVKAFNTTGSPNMANPAYPGATPMMAVAGDDADAKAVVLELAGAIGFDPVDAGPLSAARDLEHLAALWIRMAYELGAGPGIAFALLRR